MSDDNLPAFLFVMGFQMSGLGKGTVASSIGLLLKAYGLRVSAIKIDPYLNIDAGTMSPLEHGEVYVLGDGSECDLDLGNYERFVDIELTGSHNITTGQVYKTVIEREREGGYLGKTVQVIPHITDEIEQRLLTAAQMPVDDTDLQPEIVIVELGGTVGDIESEPYLHVLSQFSARTKARTCVLAIGLVIQNNGEFKTKLMQHAVKQLRSKSISPDILCVRCDVDSAEFPDEIKQKIGNSCLVGSGNVVVSGKVTSIYQVPEVLHKQRLPELICRKLGLLWRGTLRPNFTAYNCILDRLNTVDALPIRVAIVAKYTQSADTYLSLTRALEHASFALGRQIYYEIIDSELLIDHATTEGMLASFDRILVPGGFGNRGIQGKLWAIKHARVKQKPFLGICLGMQLFVIEHCRERLGWETANSTEFDPDTTYPIVQHLSIYGDDYQARSMPMGGTMRLGNQRTVLKPKSIVSCAYGGAFSIIERHRHRYEVSPLATHEQLFKTGLNVSGWTDDNLKVPQIVENVGDWLAIGCQFHPEYTSRNDKAHPLFLTFLKGEISL